MEKGSGGLSFPGGGGTLRRKSIRDSSFGIFGLESSKSSSSESIAYGSRTLRYVLGVISSFPAKAFRVTAAGGAALDLSDDRVEVPEAFVGSRSPDRESEE
jgi:hypothetical protein